MVLNPFSVLGMSIPFGLTVRFIVICFLAKLISLHCNPKHSPARKPVVASVNKKTR